MVHLQIKPNVFDCAVCHTPCNSESAKQNIFQINHTWGDKAEEILMFHINKKGRYRARRTTLGHKFPDLTLYDQNRNKVSFVEVKMVSSTFMKIQDKLPEANITPSELVVLNNSAILKYRQIAKTYNIPIYIVFFVANRPCIAQGSEYKVYYQDYDVIYNIYKDQKEQRSFTRKTVKGDIDQQGNIQNPLLKVHFSINELIPYEL
mgnify:CR=1 FL=1|tara:strand:+ start:196 stop:810 length:615 start_codon:yes stop_codon:yes gene_type:complete